MSPPTYNSLMSMAQHHHPASFHLFGNPVYPTTEYCTDFHKKNAQETFDDIYNSCEWPKAILSHQEYVGPEMLNDPDTIHRSKVEQSINPNVLSTKFQLISQKVIEEGKWDKTVVTCLVWFGPNRCIEPREMGLVLSNSLWYGPGTRQTIDDYGVDEWNKAATTIIERLFELDPDLFNSKCGSLIADGKVSSAGPGTNAVFVEFEFPTNGAPSVARWRFPKEGHVSNTHSRRSSAMSGSQDRSKS